MSLTLPNPRHIFEAVSARLGQWARRTRRSLDALRTRIILTIRWCFRVEIDEIKERIVQDQIDGLVQLNQKGNEAMQTILRLTKNLEARLQLYENEIPRMRELKRQYDLEQQGLADGFKEIQRRRESGILTLPKTNGKIIHP